MYIVSNPGVRPSSDGSYDLFVGADTIHPEEFQDKTTKDRRQKEKTRTKDKKKRTTYLTQQDREDKAKQKKTGNKKRQEHTSRRKAKSKNKGKLHLKNDVILVKSAKRHQFRRATDLFLQEN